MAALSIWSDMRASILDRFQDKDHLTQQKAWFLYLFCISAFVMFVVLSIVLWMIDAQKFKSSSAPIVIMLVLCVIAIFLIRAGKYKAAAYSMLTLQTLTASVGFLIKYNGPVIYEGFVSYIHFMYITIVFATLFCERKAIVGTGLLFVGVTITCFLAVRNRVTGESLSLVTSGFADGLIGLVLCSVLSILIITAMQRANTRLVDSVSAVRESSLKLTEISETIEASSRNIAHGASNQAASMEETSAMLREISEKAQKNSETVESAQSLMQETAKIVSTTNESLKGLRSSMHEVSEASIKTTRIVQTIDGIAFQTNLLALNAAVEAARAGEAGVGFAVVADEVRNLARKSAEASKNTQDIIHSSIENIKKSSQYAVHSDEAFSTFLKITEQLSGQLKIVEESSREQNLGIAEIEQAVDNINTVIQANAASAEETAAVSSELIHMSEDIAVFVRNLDRLIQS